MTTVAAALAAGTARLAKAGIEGAGRDARRLMAAALGIGADRLSLHLNEALTGEQAARWAAHLDARTARQPVAQITGRRAFWRHEFTVTRDTLDPRPETESLVAAALDLPWRSVLDLGTGTGAILISLLAERPGARGVGTDVSDAALAVARGNAARLGVVAEFRRADWLDGVTGQFDLIVSNPPYIAANELAGLSPEVRDWEPHGALTDGGDGLSAYRAIAAGALDHLTPGGAVAVEIGWMQGPQVAALFAAAGAQARVISDLDGRDRVVCAQFSA